MRPLAMPALLLVAFAGCLAPAPDPADEGQVEDDGTPQAALQQTLLGDHQVFTPGPGEHSFTVRVPAGGAVNVGWQLTTSGANVDTRFEGPGCQGSTAVAVGQSNSVSGSCSDLPAGEHTFAVVLSGAVVSFQAEVVGWVAAAA